MLYRGFLGFLLICGTQSRHLNRRDCTFSATASDGDTCSSLADYWGITEAQFETYNPGVDCTSGLTAGTDYCVEWDDGQTVSSTSSSTTSPTSSTTSSKSSGPTPTQTGIVSDCDAFYKAVSGDTCQGIVDNFGNFTLSDFYTWNPAIGSDCSFLFLGYYYCIGTTSGGTHTKTVTTTATTLTTSSITTGPQPEQTGIISTCTSYYKVASGDTCSNIVDDYGTFTLSDFLSWNPAVGSACSYLYLGYYVCVGIPSTPTSRPAITSTTTTTTSTAAGPTPTQSGIAQNCDAFYQVKSNDYCQKIVDDYGDKFTLVQFYSWNPAVGSDCSKLFIGYYVCVGVKS